MTMKVRDKVLKNPDRWIPSDFDAWGAGEGVGEILEVFPDIGLVDVRWPAGKAFQYMYELTLLGATS